MKKTFYFSFVCFCLLLTGCSSDDGSNGFNGSRSDAEKIIGKDLLEIMEEMGLQVNYGANPTLVEGTYKILPCVLQATSVPGENPGRTFLPVTFTLSNQDNKKLTVEYSGYGGEEVDEGVGAFIAGEGNRVSIFLTLDSEIQGYTSKTAFVITGDLTDEGFTDFQLAVFMKDNHGNLGGIFMGNNEGRIFIDGDELVERL